MKDNDEATATALVIAAFVVAVVLGIILVSAICFLGPLIMVLH